MLPHPGLRNGLRDLIGGWFLFTIDSTILDEERKWMSFTESSGPVPEFRDPASEQNPGAGSAMLPIAPVAATPLPTPGWYAEPGKPGVLRYWNGAGWEEWRKPLVEAPTVTQGQKSTAVAYVLALFIGMTGAHNFYLGRIGPAVGMLVLWIVGLLTAVFFVGSLFFIAVGIWLIVDLCLIPSYIRAGALRAVRRPV
jgi:TM2 domain-containing membrane protein YozV